LRLSAAATRRDAGGGGDGTDVARQPDLLLLSDLSPVLRRAGGVAGV